MRSIRSTISTANVLVCVCVCVIFTYIKKRLSDLSRLIDCIFCGFSQFSECIQYNTHNFASVASHVNCEKFSTSTNQNKWSSSFSTCLYRSCSLKIPTIAQIVINALYWCCFYCTAQHIIIFLFYTGCVWCLKQAGNEYARKKSQFIKLNVQARNKKQEVNIFQL